MNVTLYTSVWLHSNIVEHPWDMLVPVFTHGKSVIGIPSLVFVPFLSLDVDKTNKCSL